jgi:hypothetical protein
VNDEPRRSRGTRKIVAHFSYVECSFDQPSDDEDDEEDNGSSKRTMGGVAGQAKCRNLSFETSGIL